MGGLTPVFQMFLLAELLTKKKKPRPLGIVDQGFIRCAGLLDSSL
jgi:hypothetical protein